MEPCVVGIDSGTQGVRVIVFDLKGRIVAEGAALHEPPVSPEPGAAEQDPHDLWEKLRRASRQAMASLSGSGWRPAAASLAAQRSVVLAVDLDGRPLRPAFSWLDRRRAEAVTPLPGISAEQRQRQVQSKANWMKVHEPGLYGRAARFLSVSGWLTYRLCGSFRDAPGGLGGVFPLDISRLGWSTDPLTYALLGMPAERLPEICQPGSLLGHITPDAAQQTGLPEGLPLIAAAGDKSCEMLGAGAVRPAQGYVSYGSLAALEVISPVPLLAGGGQYWTTPGAMRGTWHLEFGMEYGYLMVRWFCRQFGAPEPDGQALADGALEQTFSALAAGLPPGAGGLVLAPYWSRLGIAPGAQSVVLGLGKDHTRAHLFRAILEGIAFGLRDGMEILARDTGVALEEVFIGGGGAQSDLAVQITADVLGLPVVRAQTVQTCALGAAIEASLGAELFSSYAEAVAQMCRPDSVFQPEPARQEAYAAIYTRVYQKLYPALAPVFAEYGRIFDKA
jgi:sugar (pentulose or hexulose) kinase